MIRRIQLVGQIATHRIAIALKYTLKQKIVQQEGLDQVNWSSQSRKQKHRYTNKAVEIRYYGVNSATREISRNDRKLPKIQK